MTKRAMASRGVTTENASSEPGMTLFFFDFDDGRGLELDTNGVEFADIEDARRSAAETLALIGKETFGLSVLPTLLRAVIRGADGTTLSRFSLRFALEAEEA